MSRLLCAAILIAILVASPASAAWTPPTTLSNADEANPRAQAAFGGSVLTGWLKPTAALSKRLGAPSPITTADPFEQVWAGGLDAEGNAVVLTVRRHQPRRRVRAIIDGTRRTISDGSHTANAPVLAVAPDGTAACAPSSHHPRHKLRLSQIVTIDSHRGSYTPPSVQIIDNRAD